MLFPAKEEKDVGSENGSIQSGLEGHERILFVDDEESLVVTVKYRLRKLGYEVVAKQNPVKALEVFREDTDSFDLVITDMIMPEMTGDILVKEILAVRPDVKIILCTGVKNAISEDEAKAIGVDAFILKPMLASEMAKTVRKVLDAK